MKITNKLQELSDMFSINKMLMYLCLVLLIYSTLVTIALGRYISGYEIRPYFIRMYDKSEQVIQIEPLEKNEKALDLAKEKFAMDYVMQRETIDLITEGDRWSALKLRHSDELEKQFSNLMREDNKESPLREFHRRQIQRKVEVVTAASLAPVAPNTYRVEWVAYDSSVRLEDRAEIYLNVSAIQPRKNEFVSIVTVEIDTKKKVKHEHRLINPFNIKVVNYRVDKKVRRK